MRLRATTLPCWSRSTGHQAFPETQVGSHLLLGTSGRRPSSPPASGQAPVSSRGAQSMNTPSAHLHSNIYSLFKKLPEFHKHHQNHHPRPHASGLAIRARGAGCSGATPLPRSSAHTARPAADGGRHQGTRTRTQRDSEGTLLLQVDNTTRQNRDKPDRRPQKPRAPLPAWLHSAQKIQASVFVSGFFKVNTF